MSKRSLLAACAALLTTVAPAASAPHPATALTRSSAGVVAVPALGAEPTLAVRWTDTLLECVRRSRLGPPMVARAIGVTQTCGYDAWAVYDAIAVGTRFGAEVRRPPAERTPANAEKAYSYAMYRALLDLFPGHGDFIRGEMVARGYDPDDASVDLTTPSGIGNRCVQAVLDARHVDGSNQLGDLHAGAYTDYTGYAPVNTLDQILDPNHWQPLRFSDGAGGTVAPGFIAPHWYRVTPFALPAGDAFRPPPPALYPHGSYRAQAEEIIHLNATLDDREKMIAEYWADGPRTELPPGHWQLFGEFLSARDHHTFGDDVKMYFMLGNAVMDAGIAAWDAKRFYDYVRPITAIRFLKAGKPVRQTVPFQGVKRVRGEDWLPYQPATFITPPFPEYVSGHSAFSTAAAEVLKRLTGSDHFGGSVTFPAGVSRVEPGVVPAAPLTLYWDTFSVASDESGMSRRYGGIHFEDGDLEGRLLGRKVGAAVFERAMRYIHGNASGAGIAARVELEFAPGDAVAAGPATLDAWPNPVGRRPLAVSLAIPRSTSVRIGVFDVQGREVARLADGAVAAGRHEWRWERGAAPAGLYFVRATAGGARLAAKVVVSD